MKGAKEKLPNQLLWSCLEKTQKALKRHPKKKIPSVQEEGIWTTACEKTILISKVNAT